MRDKMELLEMLNDVPAENGRYVITEGMDPDLRRMCERTNALKDKREKILSERRKIKRSLGL
ncbi:MAG: hypothetical protein IKF82_01370 [Bacilli bacterium]|nr:hypothetical protein [Bacilli bacterium]